MHWLNFWVHHKQGIVQLNETDDLISFFVILTGVLQMNIFLTTNIARISLLVVGCLPLNKKMSVFEG